LRGLRRLDHAAMTIGARTRDRGLTFGGAKRPAPNVSSVNPRTSA
jgi:hypothetical protein